MTRTNTTTRRYCAICAHHGDHHTDQCPNDAPVDVDAGEVGV